MSTAAVEPEPVPLARDFAGRLMVTGTRAPMDTLVTAFKRGDSPETIHECYDTVPLADVYLVLAYYLRHKTEVEVYLTGQEQRGAEIQARIEARNPPEGIRARLLSRLS